MSMDDLFADQPPEDQSAIAGPVTCLGMTFENDDARRAHFTEELRKKLQNPEFRKIEGFPIGSDEDILNLSDPPYYTACPNPFLSLVFEEDKDEVRESVSVFADDVSGSKHSQSYNVHPYHTKVPPDAIVPLIKHYTEPGDIILDPFAGTGMTGVAVDYCNAEKVRSEPRSTILCDLSVVASFIARNYTTTSPMAAAFELWDEALERVEESTQYLYRTEHTGWRANEKNVEMAKNREPSGIHGTIIYIVWSDVFQCPNCAFEVPYWDTAVELFNCVVHDVFECPSCKVSLCKEPKFQKKNSANLVERATETWYDPVLGETIIRQKRKPSLISYDVSGTRYEKWPDDKDLARIEESENLKPLVQATPMMFKGERWGDTWRAGVHTGITHWHHFFTNRSLHVLGELLWISDNYRSMWFGVTIGAMRLSRLNRYMPKHRDNRSREVVGPLSGTLYVPSICIEVNPIPYLKKKRKALASVWCQRPSARSFVTTQSSGNLSMIQDETIDYIFTDPPFGDNLFYSELNFLWESLLKIHTCNEVEAIVSPAGGKVLSDYTRLMMASLRECYRVLKPGRWITVEFHNSKNSVWTAIHEAIETSGFVVADVRTLDKKKGTTKQLTFTNAVKQDLIISAYKPSGDLEERFALAKGTEQGAWDFVRTHLGQLPVFIEKDSCAIAMAERQKHLLFDRMVAFHVQRSVTVPVSAAEFYVGISQRFAERDGMYFLTEQVAEYDKKRMSVKEILQLSIFVNDEASAIQWLKQAFTSKPQSFQDIHPQFMQEVGAWSKTETPLELSTLLNQNFLCYDGKGPVPEQIHAYLSSNWKELRKLSKDVPALVAKARNRWYVPDPNKAGDLEKLREKALLKEFEEYKEVKKKLKVFRLEAVRAGFKKAWQERDYAVIVTVADKIPNNVLEEDPKLLMWYDQAVTRMGGE